MQGRDHRQRQQLAEYADDDEWQGRAGGEPITEPTAASRITCVR